ncbi:MAG: PAS domain S-box protein [Cytophagales bacterium]|nr:PAS domain S-box protein [Cytophagales bacterium]
MPFKYLPDYARFVLDHHLDELVTLNLERARQVELPLLRHFAAYAPAQLLEYSKERLKKLLLQLVEGVALEEHQQELRRWLADQLPGISRSEIEVRDLALTPHTRRYAFRKLLVHYTKDWTLQQAILEELDWYYTQTLSGVLETYVQIQQEQLAQQRDFLETILNTTQEGISALDQEWKITLWNRALEERTGVKKEAIVGRQVFEVFPANAQSQEQEAIRLAQAGEKVHLEQLPIRSREGYYDMDIVPLLSKEGTPAGCISFSRDVTEKTKAARELELLNQTLTAANEELSAQREELATANEELHEHLTQLEESQQALFESEARLQEAQSIAHLGHWSYQQAQQVVYWSDEMQLIFNRCPSLSDLAEDGYYRFVHPEDQAMTRQRIEKSLLTGEPFSFEHRILRPDGSVRWVLLQGKISQTREGTLERISGTCLDITERKEAQLALEAEKYFIEKLTDASPDVITLYDLEQMRNLYSSREVYSILGYGEEELRQITSRGPEAFVEYFHPEDLSKVISFLTEYKTYRGEAPRELEYRIKNAAGEWVSILDRYRVFKHNSEGLPVQIMGVARDITERKRAEREIEGKNVLLQEAYEEMAAAQEELRQTNQELYRVNTQLEKVNGELEERVQARTLALERALEETRTKNEQLEQLNRRLDVSNQQLDRINKDLDTFVYTASHDLRAPIANLSGLQQVLLKKLAGKTAPQEQEVLGLMEQAVGRLSRTIDALTQVVKVQKEQQRSDELSFREMLGEVRYDLSALLESSHGQISAELQVDQVRFPRQYLRSIVYNLLSNALKYRSPDRELLVKVVTFREGNWVVLCVEDNGLGIAPGQMDKLFQMFKRLHSHVEGTGIGLYMVKQMVENYGGRIQVESKLDEGTQFKVYFPG